MTKEQMQKEIARLNHKIELDIGCMCMGFQMGRPSALRSASFSKISVGQVLPGSLM